MDEALLGRRIADWKKSEYAAREAERLAAAAHELGHERPLAERAVRLRRIADVIRQSIMEDMHLEQPRFSVLASSPTSAF